MIVVGNSPDFWSFGVTSGVAADWVQPVVKTGDTLGEFLFHLESNSHCPECSVGRDMCPQVDHSQEIHWEDKVFSD